MSEIGVQASCHDKLSRRCGPCQARRDGPRHRDRVAVAPLVVLDGSAPRLVGTCTLVTNGKLTVAISSAAVLRGAPEPLAICTRLDGSQTLPVPSWMMGRRAGLGIIELRGDAVAHAFGDDVVPLDLGSVCASVATRGAPSCLVAFTARRWVHATAVLGPRRRGRSGQRRGPAARVAGRGAHVGRVDRRRADVHVDAPRSGPRPSRGGRAGRARRDPSAARVRWNRTAVRRR